MTHADEPAVSGGDEGLSLRQALGLGIALQTELHFEDAEKVYRRILEVEPEQPDALHFLGVIRHQRGASAEGAALVRRAIEQAPDYADAQLNLGNIHAQCGDDAAAEVQYRAFLRLRPGHVGARVNLGQLLLRRQDYAQAAQLLREAAAGDPEFPWVWHKLGRALESLPGRQEEAAECFRKAIAQREQLAHKITQGNSVIEEDFSSYYALARLYRALGRREQAIDVFRRWLQQNPGDPVAQHYLVAQTGEHVPDRAADDYVRAAFDRYADSFDSHLRGALEYRAPELLCAALAAQLPPPARALDVLDAGVGTGLCGPLLAPHARRLEGVDLSPRMIEKAQGRGYDALHVAELGAFLAQREAEYDLIVSADTLCYFGALEAVAAAAQRALRPRGVFAFTVEKAEDAAGYHLATTGRYRHGQAYVRGCLAACGLRLVACTEAQLRIESGEPVLGYVVVAVRAP